MHVSIHGTSFSWCLVKDGYLQVADLVCSIKWYNQ